MTVFQDFMDLSVLVCALKLAWQMEIVTTAYWGMVRASAMKDGTGQNVMSATMDIMEVIAHLLVISPAFMEAFAIQGLTVMELV